MPALKKKQIWIGLIAIYVARLFYYIILHIAMRSQLEAIEGNPDFPTTELFNITENHITAQSVIYNKKMIIGYACCIDSFYLVNIVKVGTIKDSSNLFKSIRFFSKEKSSIDDVSHGYFQAIFPAIPNNLIDFTSFYDLHQLPSIDVENIKINLDGELLRQDTLTNHVLSYAIKAIYISFKINNSKKKSMNSGSFHAGIKVFEKKNLPISKLVFYRTANNILYIMNISTLDDSEPDISKILKL